MAIAEQIDRKRLQRGNQAWFCQRRLSGILEDFAVQSEADPLSLLLESGELEQHLVKAPSAIMVKVSTVIGFTLILVGLGLLTLVGIEFFTRW
jgi:hypothetical protein